MSRIPARARLAALFARLRDDLVRHAPLLIAVHATSPCAGAVPAAPLVEETTP